MREASRQRPFAVTARTRQHGWEHQALIASHREQERMVKGSPCRPAASGGYSSSTAASRPRCAASATALRAGWSCPTCPPPPPPTLPGLRCAPRGAQPPAATRCASMAWLPPSTAALSALQLGAQTKGGRGRPQVVDYRGPQRHSNAPHNASLAPREHRPAAHTPPAHLVQSAPPEPGETHF